MTDKWAVTTFRECMYVHFFQRAYNYPDYSLATFQWSLAKQNFHACVETRDTIFFNRMCHSVMQMIALKPGITWRQPAPYNFVAEWNGLSTIVVWHLASGALWNLPFSSSVVEQWSARLWLGVGLHACWALWRFRPELWVLPLQLRVSFM
jgi:hypothetical protein